MLAKPWSWTMLENAEPWEDDKQPTSGLDDELTCIYLSDPGTCEVVEEVEGDGEAGGLRVEQGRLRTT